MLHLLLIFSFYSYFYRYDIIVIRDAKQTEARGSALQYTLSRWPSDLFGFMLQLASVLDVVFLFMFYRYDMIAVTNSKQTEGRRQQYPPNTFQVSAYFLLINISL